MKEIHHIGVLLMISFLICTPISVQGFPSSKTYQQIQVQSYSSAGLRLETDVFKRSKKSIGLAVQPTASISVDAKHISARNTFASAPVRVARTSSFHVNAWQGSTTSVGADMPAPAVAKRRSNGIGGGGNGTPGNPTDVSGGIGGGNDGIPNNPTDVPVGNLPMGVILLLALSYAALKYKTIYSLKAKHTSEI